MIRNIIYLDEEKMYSMSSQVFEGLTDYILKEVSSVTEKSEQQKGPIASGRALADAMILGEKSLEKRFLHDHSLSLFEGRLVELDILSDIDIDSCEGSDRSFVRIKAPASFVDAAKMNALLSSFNELGEALTHITKFSEIEGIRVELEALKTPSNEKQIIAQIRQIEREFSNTTELAKKAGLQHDSKFLKNLALITKFGFSDQLELQQRIGARLYSACLKRECLRESDSLVVRKYSRRTEKELVVLGVVTQSEAEKQPVPPLGTEKTTTKEAVTNMVNHIAAMEEAMVGKAPYETVIDPIAVYVTL